MQSERVGGMRLEMNPGRDTVRFAQVNEGDDATVVQKRSFERVQSFGLGGIKLPGTIGRSELFGEALELMSGVGRFERPLQQMQIAVAARSGLDDHPRVAGVQRHSICHGTQE